MSPRPPCTVVARATLCRDGPTTVLAAPISCRCHSHNLQSGILQIVPLPWQPKSLLTNAALVNQAQHQSRLSTLLGSSVVVVSDTSFT